MELNGALSNSHFVSEAMTPLARWSSPRIEKREALLSTTFLPTTCKRILGLKQNHVASAPFVIEASRVSVSLSAQLHNGTKFFPIPLQ